MRRVLVCMCLVAACRESRPRPPAKTDTIVFSHDFHAKLDFDCDTCHTGIAAAKDLAQSFLPKEAKCLECHAEHKEQNDCAFCHTDPQHASSYAPRPRDIEVSHAAHEAQKLPCTRCHPALVELTKPWPPRPTMDTCTSCHEHETQVAEARCRPCHLDLTRFPIEPVGLYSHRGRFLDEHKTVARTSAEACAQCHDQTFCADCHAKTVAMRIELRFPEEVERAFIHRGDYVTRHTFDARSAPESCARCHGTSFCSSCHAQQNLVPQPFVATPRDPHPAGWASPGSVPFHGDAARRDISSCAACHDQGASSICVSCHRVGGVGGNPHPPGWTDRHDQKEMRSNSMCLICHS